MSAHTVCLPREMLEIIGTLNSAGFEAFAVGGCVRDFIRKEKPSDYDIATNAVPADVKRVFSHCKTIDTGIKHGTVTVIFENFKTEITTYRTDGAYSDNRRPDSVEFSNNLLDDLARRDFTMNAVAYAPSAGLVDPFGGIDDIMHKVIRAVGDANARFGEDALRILRALRFAAVLNFKTESGTAAALHRCAELLKNISGERIFAEFKKLLCGVNASAVLNDYRDVFEVIFPCMARVTRDEYAKSARAVRFADGGELVKAAAYFRFAGASEAEATMHCLKASNAEIRRVFAALSCRTDGLLTSADVRKSIFKHGENALCDALRLRLSFCETETERERARSLMNMLSEITDKKLCCSVGGLNINGKDIIDAGIASGCGVGRILNALVTAVIDGKVANERAELIEYAARCKI